MNISSNISSIQSQQNLLNTRDTVTKEIPKQIVAQNTTDVNASAIKTQDEILGSLLDIKA